MDPSFRFLSYHAIMASIAFAMLANTIPSFAQESTRNGALLGGATGAIIGGIIGNNKNDQTAEGALIGGAVGAVTGGLIGHHRDRVAMERQRQAAAARVAASRSYPAPRYAYPSYPPYQHRYAGPGQPTIVYSAPVVTRYGSSRSPARAMPMPTRQPVTIADVIQLSRSGVSDAVIVSRIQTNGMAQALSVDDVIYCSQQGVSDEVLAAMQGDYRTSLPGESVPSNEIVPNSQNSDPPLLPVPPLKNQRRGF